MINKFKGFCQDALDAACWWRWNEDLPDLEYRTFFLVDRIPVPAVVLRTVGTNLGEICDREVLGIAWTNWCWHAFPDYGQPAIEGEWDGFRFFGGFCARWAAVRAWRKL